MEPAATHGDPRAVDPAGEPYAPDDDAPDDHAAEGPLDHALPADRAVHAPPPPPPPPAPWHSLRGSSAGQLTMGWRILLAVGWGAVFLGFALVWKASVEIGLAAWWLGPPAQPRPIPIRLFPFLGPSIVIIGAFNGWRWMPWVGIGAAVLSAAIALGEMARYPRLGVAELTLAAGGALISIAAFAGMYQRATEPPTRPDGGAVDAATE